MGSPYTSALDQSSAINDFVGRVKSETHSVKSVQTSSVISVVFPILNYIFAVETFKEGHAVKLKCIRTTSAWFFYIAEPAVVEPGIADTIVLAGGHWHCQLSCQVCHFNVRSVGTVWTENEVSVYCDHFLFMLLCELVHVDLNEIKSVLLSHFLLVQS